MRLIAATVAICTAFITPFLYAQNADDYEADRKFWSEISNLVTTTNRNYCFMLIRNNSDRQAGLNRFRISPSEACDCAATEAASAMAASPSYRAYARVLINSLDASTGKPPRFSRDYEQDAAITEASRTFNESWANCFMRLKKN